MDGMGIIITMASITVAGAVTQGILNAFGRNNEATYVGFATVASLGVTALTVFAKVITSLRTLG